MSRINENQFNVPQFNQVEDLNSSQNDSQSAKPPLKRSFLLQDLLNYFDDADARVREGRNTLDAQFFNGLALRIEDVRMRLGREQTSMDMGACPLNLDNRGVYYKLNIPGNYEFESLADGSLVSPKVRVFTSEQRWKFIQPYDDTLPIPAGVVSAGDPVPCESLVVLQFKGNGLLQETQFGSLDFRGFLYVKVDGLDADNHTVTVRLEGYAEPRVISLSGQETASETLSITEESIYRTRIAWNSLERITVRDLPEGATITIAISPAAFALFPEPERPVIHSAFRDVPLERYWRINGAYLQEAAFFNRISGFETVQSYLCNPTFSTIALEPNTSGMLAVSGGTLFYLDRREPMPDDLKGTGLFQEPLYNLLVVLDDGAVGQTRMAQLIPVRNARSGECRRYRYTVRYPNGKKYCLTPEGHHATLTPNSGWRVGDPKSLSIAVTDPGTYRFAIETADINAQIYEDVSVYANLTVAPLAKFDISTMVATAEALVFDRYQRLWIWDGAFLVPVRLVYDNFVFDEGTRSIYLTQSYDQVELS